MGNIYNTYINAKKSLNKEVDNNDGFKRIASNGTIKDGKSYCSEVRTESYTKKPFKGNSYSEEKPRWFKEEDESTKEEKVENGEPKNDSSEEPSKPEGQQQTDTTVKDEKQKDNNGQKETENKALNTVLEDINQLIDTASSKLDGPFTYGSMADYLSEVITKSLLLLAIDEDINQQSTEANEQQKREDAEEKEIDISSNNNEGSNEGQEQQQQKKEEENKPEEESKEN